MSILKSFGPDHLKDDALKSGLFQCQRCGLVWFGKPDLTTCPEGPHGNPVHIALLCRYCDVSVSIDGLAEHLNDPRHLSCARRIEGQN